MEVGDAIEARFLMFRSPCQPGMANGQSIMARCTETRVSCSAHVNTAILSSAIAHVLTWMSCRQTILEVIGELHAALSPSHV